MHWVLFAVLAVIMFLGMLLSAVFLVALPDSLGLAHDAALLPVLQFVVQAVWLSAHTALAFVAHRALRLHWLGVESAAAVFE